MGLIENDWDDVEGIESLQLKARATNADEDLSRSDDNLRFEQANKDLKKF